MKLLTIYHFVYTTYNFPVYFDFDEDRALNRLSGKTGKGEEKKLGE